MDKEMETGMELIQDGEQLAASSVETFPMTVEEADVLLGYVEGHGYALAGKDGRLYHGDVCGQPDTGAAATPGAGCGAVIDKLFYSCGTTPNPP